MSVNITVNGKFTKHIKNPLLIDIEQTRKQLEQERRKERIQQVRAQSKELAKKIRNDVSKEKEKQLRNLEAVKNQELNCWREHILAQKCNDYQKALSQVGSAHYAAQAENARKKDEARLRAECYDRNKSRMRANLKKPQAVAINHKFDGNEQPTGSNNLKTKRSLHVCFDEKLAQCSCSSQSGTDSEKSDIEDCVNTCPLLLCSSLSSSCSDTSSFPNKNTKCTQTSGIQAQNLKKVPTVLLDVNVESSDSTAASPPEEIRDKHVESNRQFDRVKRVSPRKASISVAVQANEADLPSSEVSKNPQMNDKNACTKILTELEQIPPAPRYTQISDLIAKQKNIDDMSRRNEASNDLAVETIIDVSSSVQKSSSGLSIAPVSTASKQSQVAKKTMSKSLAPKTKSPQKSTSLMPPPLQRPQSTKSIVTTTTQASQETMQKADGKSIASTAVQYYDYNNKFSKEYNQIPIATVTYKRTEDEPNAMEEARLEKELQKTREIRMEEFRKKNEERGKKALEREQVRRDCLDLTEKLEALAQQKANLLPSDANLHGRHYLAEQTARKETKMNSVIEDLLSRPTIITCPEVRPERPIISQTISKATPSFSNPNYLNLGDQEGKDSNEHTASESCGSILLGYIDDQREEIRHSLQSCEGSSDVDVEKNKKLTELLQRIESLRASLLTELRKDDKILAVSVERSESPKPHKSRSLHNKKEQNIVPYGEAKKKLERPKETAVANKRIEENKDPRSLAIEKRELELQKRENLLQEKLNELISIQKSLGDTETKIRSKSPGAREVQITSERETIVERASKQKPLEIVIKVKGDKKPIYKQNQKTKTLQRPPIQSQGPQPSSLPSNTAGYIEHGRRNSYDSNSTAYRSLPNALPNATDQFVNRVLSVDPISQRQKLPDRKKSQTSSSLTSSEEILPRGGKRITTNINPLIAQYIQRLLGMSRNSVKALEVSSSDIETPSSSIINTAGNINGDSMLTEDHVQRVEKFITENRSFINELEESIRMQSNASLETSMRRFEKIWKQKLNDNKSKAPIEDKAQSKAEKPRKVQETSNKISKQKEVKIATKKAPTTLQLKKVTTAPQSQTTEQIKAPKVTQSKTGHKSAAESPISAKRDNRQASDLYATQSQLQHYAELTKNCSNRIAELTDLITKVRQEKQRLLEASLTSVSENERHSTEYCDLPGKEKTDNSKDQAKQLETHDKTISSDSSTQSKLIDSNTPNEMPSSSTDAPAVGGVTLEKHKQTGKSRDSGIFMPSRPATAQGIDNTDQEPQSIESTGAATTTQSTSSQKKPRAPPATLHRFSPQLPDEEIAHELSTIVEVDTPATSRINTSLQGNGTKATPSTHQPPPPPPAPPQKAPMTFPTFEEYAKELNLDFTILDAEQSVRMEHEYNELIEALKVGNGGKAYNYEEFPTLTSYLNNLTANNESSQSLGTIEDLFSCLRLAPISAQPFPTHREYVKRLTTNTPESGEFLDTESLENLLDSNSNFSETESEVLNIEDELKRRKIRPFQSPVATEPQGVSSSAGGNQHAHSKSFKSINAGSLPFGQLSSSDSASEKFQRELLSLGLKWPQAMRNKEQKAKALSSSTSDSVNKVEVKTKSNKKKSKSPAFFSDSESSDRPLNLRDFLTRQLLKHAAVTSSCDSSLSGDSFKSQFFHAVLDSMTPNATPGTNANTAVGGSATRNTVERQKTSTPVPSHSPPSHTQPGHAGDMQSSQSQLFSVESHLSSVHYQEHSSTLSNQKDKSNDKTNLEKEKGS